MKEHTQTRGLHGGNEQELLLLVTDLEDKIERLEGARSRLEQAGRSDAHLSRTLGRTLRQLRRERASCLSALLS